MASNPLSKTDPIGAVSPPASTTTPTNNANVDSSDPFASGSDFDARKFIGATWKGRENGSINEVRSFLWALLLGAVSTGKLGLQPWVDALAMSRVKYSEMKKKHAPNLDVSGLDPNVANPLAPMSANNPWAKRHEDQEILDEIWKDVERTYQEFEVYRKESTRRQLQQVLYNYCKENKKEYRQGMNELCAVILFVVATNKNSDLLMKYNLAPTNSDEIEADTYFLFERLMSKGAGHMFLTESSESREKRAAAMKEANKNKAGMGNLKSNINTGTIPDADTALLARCQYVYHTVFKQVDPQLYKHLHNSLGLQPQLFLLRWIRCLFTRELSLNQVIECWDAILMDGFVRNKGSGAVVDETTAVSTGEVALAASGCFPLVDYLAIAFANEVRDDLLKEDYSGALAIMLRYPQPDDVWFLVSKSEQLRDPTNSMTRLVNKGPKRGAIAQPPSQAQVPNQIPRRNPPKTAAAPKPRHANPLQNDAASDGSVSRPSPVPASAHSNTVASSKSSPITNPLAPQSTPPPQTQQRRVAAPTRDPVGSPPQNASNGSLNRGYSGKSGDSWLGTGKSLLGSAAAMASTAYQQAAPAVRSAYQQAAAGVSGNSASIDPDRLRECIRRLEAFKEDLEWSNFDVAVAELKACEQRYLQQQAQLGRQESGHSTTGGFQPANF
eukprot:gene328-1125_t